MLLHSVVAERHSAKFSTPDSVLAALSGPLSQTIASLGLPIRSVNAMRAVGIVTLRDAADWSLRDLKSLPQVGPAALATLLEALHGADLALQPSPRRRRL